MIEPALMELLQTVRQRSQQLCQPLAIEDYVIQSIEDVSPPKWHLAHTTWFFETFILREFKANYRLFDTAYAALFNSYYQTLGKPYPRPRRGLLARPTVAEIMRYRAHVDEHLIALLDTNTAKDAAKISELVLLGLQHEMQHQELLLMDIKYNFAINPLLPAYRTDLKQSLGKDTANCERASGNIPRLEYHAIDAGLIKVGHANATNATSDFCYDNELPQHDYYLAPFKIANRLVTNAEYLAFIEQGGYQHAHYWLADGWDWLQREQCQAPLYWRKVNNQWYEFSLGGLQALSLAQPVCHVSYYEADAYARWADARLPTEFEWERVAQIHADSLKTGNFLQDDYLQPRPVRVTEQSQIMQLFGDVWQWSASAYAAYPGYQRNTNALGEYNGKFMSNQMVLRGGSCLTPREQLRTTYRNFFQAEKRWAMTGIRLAN